MGKRETIEVAARRLLRMLDVCNSSHGPKVGTCEPCSYINDPGAECDCAISALRAALDRVSVGSFIVEDSPETVERVARALAVSDGYTPDASRELVSTFFEDARAVLAALKEVSRG